MHTIQCAVGLVSHFSAATGKEHSLLCATHGVDISVPVPKQESWAPSQGAGWVQKMPHCPALSSGLFDVQKGGTCVLWNHPHHKARGSKACSDVFLAGTWRLEARMS